MWLLLVVSLFLTQSTEGVTVQGVTQNDEGTPLRNTLVRFETVKENKVLAETRTDGKGRFSLTIPQLTPSVGSEEEYTLAFYAQSYITSKATVTFRNGSLLFDVQGKRGRSHKLNFRKGEIVDLGMITLKKFSYGLIVMVVGLCSVLLILTVLVLVLRVSGTVVKTMEKRNL